MQSLGTARMAISGLPQWLVYLPAPLFCGIMLIFAVESLLGISQQPTAPSPEE
jgi:TRAP-type C4-dicarboxylate transport system permease small subunit